jgi:hypothetical protein
LPPKRAAMEKTSTVFIDAFVFINAFIPLLPAVFILIQKKYFKESLILLMVLCLLNCIKNIFLLPGNRGNENQVQNVFSIIELTIIFQICASSFQNRLRQSINISLVIFLSVLVTFYFLKGIDVKRISVEIIQNFIIVIDVSIALFCLMESASLSIFKSPLFWIAAGTLFYFLIAVLVNTLGEGNVEGRDSIIILNIASLVRYVFYNFAVLFYNGDNDSEKSSPV